MKIVGISLGWKIREKPTSFNDIFEMIDYMYFFWIINPNRIQSRIYWSFYFMNILLKVYRKY